VVPFCIAGVQMNVELNRDNLDVMEHRIDAIAHRFPWVQMVLFSELAALGPSTSKAQPLPCAVEERFCSIAKRYGLWLLPGSLFEFCNRRVTRYGSGSHTRQERRMNPQLTTVTSIKPASSIAYVLTRLSKARPRIKQACYPATISRATMAN